MSVRIAGIGCVTPLGGDLDTIWRRIEAGERAAVVEVVRARSVCSQRRRGKPRLRIAAASLHPHKNRGSPSSSAYRAAVCNIRDDSTSRS